MEKLIYIPIAIGVCCGAFLAYWTTRPLIAKFGKDRASLRFAQWGSLIGALAMAFPAFVFSMIAGGSLGGLMAELAGSNDILKHIGVPCGLSLGIAIVLGGGLAVGVILGGLVGAFVARAVHKSEPGDQPG
jgi:uncharacterized protein YneF (UPF0154 family)